MSELSENPPVAPEADSAAENDIYVEIHVLVGSECITIFRVPPGEYLIGRDSSCHLSIDAENVSRMHARLAFHGHRIILEDLESANGTRIGGIPISLPTPIQNGTEIHIGAARLLVQFSEDTLSKISAALSDPNLGLEPIRNELTQAPYHVTGTIAEGGMGLVVKARDQRVRRMVAMKVLRSGFEFSADKLLRFVGEAQLTGQLEHPNIVPVYQLGVSESGQTFYTMKYVRGQTLEEVLLCLQNEDPETVAKYNLATLLTVFQKVGDAVAFAHSRGVVHRDLKPANIMIGAFGEVLVMDWGLAKRINEGNLASSAAAQPAPQRLAPKATRRFNANAPVWEGFASHRPRGFYTLEGAVVGTPPYISPEQARGDSSPKISSDIHVLGSILYSIITLRPPLLLHNMEDVIDAVAENRFIPIREMPNTPGDEGAPPPKLIHCTGEKLPEGLVAVVEKAMHADPLMRYASVEELQKDISAWQNGFATKAEQASILRQILLLIERRKTEFTILAVFLVILVASFAYFLRCMALDRYVLAQERQALAENNRLLENSNQRYRVLIDQLRETADQNCHDAINHLSKRSPRNALEQINLALVGSEDFSPEQALFLVVKGLCFVQLERNIEALAELKKASRIIPGMIPLDLIETDLDPASSISRPENGWPWESLVIEKIRSLRTPPKSKRTP